MNAAFVSPNQALPSQLRRAAGAQTLVRRDRLLQHTTKHLSHRSPRAVLVRGDGPQRCPNNASYTPAEPSQPGDIIEALESDARAAADSVRPAAAAVAAPRAQDGPPLRYNQAELKKYWDARSLELNQRYLAFAGRAAPFVGSVLRKLATGTLMQDNVIAELAVQAREGMEALGPTYIKMGQMMSIRPDVIPQPAMEELQKLQDGVAQFDNDVARLLIEEELGRPLEDIFSEFSEEPIAAASLAQVYRARLRESGVEVAVKVQRPDALTLCSKDMYVLQRAIGVYQGIVQRWTAQNVDYNALLQSFASGFYEELDFENEARNQAEARRAIISDTGGSVYVPKVFFNYCSRRLLVTEFVHGKKLTDCEPQELRRLTAVAQDCFLRQLLEPGQKLHCDAHGGNQLAWLETATYAAQPEGFNLLAPPSKRWEDGEDGTLIELGLKPDLILIDFGLTMAIPEEDKPKLIVSVVHMANKDWDAVTDDLIALGFLEHSIDRSAITPLLGRILTPYVLDGGGANAFMKEGVFSPSFQNLMRDLSAAAVEIPFSIPAYWPVIGRGIAILEGIALAGDPNYKIVLNAYPYVTRKLLQEGNDASFRSALNAILYPTNEYGVKQPRPSARRIISLLNSALGRAAVSSSAGGMLDLDAVPTAEDAASIAETLAFLGTEQAQAIRQVLVDELVNGGDLVLRYASRRVASNVQNLNSLPLPLPSLPFLSPPRLPLLNPAALIPETVRASVLDRVAPPLTAEEEIYAGDILELSETFFGLDLKNFATNFASPQQALQLMNPILTSVAGRSKSPGGVLDVNEGTDRFAQELIHIILDADVVARSGMTGLMASRRDNGSPDQDLLNSARLSLQSITREVISRLQVQQRKRIGLSRTSE